MKLLKLYCCLLLIFFLSENTFGQKKEHTSPMDKYPGYEFVGHFNNGLAKVKKNKKWGYIDTTGNVVIPPKYNEVENFSDGIARVRTGTKWGLVSASGQEIIKPTFDAIYEFINGKAMVLLNGEKYYMNKEGQRVD